MERISARRAGTELSGKSPVLRQQVLIEKGERVPSSTTTVIGVRVPNEQAAAFRRQAARFGLTPSGAAAALVAGALAIEQPPRAA